MRVNRLLAYFVAAALLFGACGDDDAILPETNQEGGPYEDSTGTVQPEEDADNIYQFSVLDGHNDSVSLSLYRGQVLLVVNTATRCGYTPQYEDLQRIYETYSEQGVTILDFPCNQFNNQAPGSYEDIHDFCTSRYNITFPQFAKIDVNGASASPLYVWLKSKKPGDIQWNFTKFLVDRDGNVVRRFEPNSSMTVMENAIRNQL